MVNYHKVALGEERAHRQKAASAKDSGEQNVHDARRTHIHECSQQAETRGKFAAQRKRTLR